MINISLTAPQLLAVSTCWSLTGSSVGSFVVVSVKIRHERRQVFKTQTGEICKILSHFLLSLLDFFKSIFQIFMHFFFLDFILFYKHFSQSSCFLGKAKTLSFSFF